MPGVQTASEVMAALARGFEVVKLFPAVPAGGIAALKALAGPFPQVRFCPTGGIGEETLADWLALPNVASVGGSWLAPAADIRAGNWPAITARARRAVGRLRSVCIDAMSRAILDESASSSRRRAPPRSRPGT